VDLAENAANNWPLRGGKYSLFEGGIKVAAFISGGLVPAKLRGTTNNGIVHVADWYATFAKLAGQDPTDHRAAAAGLPPIDSLDVWPFLSGVETVSPRTSFPVGDNCVVQGDWKLITTKTSPDFWQGPKFPNSSSAATLFFLPPPRPYPRLQPCYTGNNSTIASAQQWTAPAPSKQGSPPFVSICTIDPDFKDGPCLNVQNSRSRLIMWPRASTTNAQFGLRGSGATTTMSAAMQGETGCIGAAVAHGELLAYPDCNVGALPQGAIVHGWTYNASSLQLQIPAADGSGLLCIAADLNGTQPPNPSPDSGTCANGCLFNVADDPTEQNNMYEADPERVRSMTALLAEMSAKFFQNHDKFLNDCPAGTQDCACWMAKSRYGGFMGPFSMLNMSLRRPIR